MRVGPHDGIASPPATSDGMGDRHDFRKAAQARRCLRNPSWARRGRHAERESWRILPLRHGLPRGGTRRSATVARRTQVAAFAEECMAVALIRVASVPPLCLDRDENQPIAHRHTKICW